MMSETIDESFRLRDLSQVMAHAHGQEIEELDAPPPDS
jgi:hypothetical protein